MSRLETIEEAYRNGNINAHKRDMLILSLQKDEINAQRRRAGLFENGYHKINKS